MIYTKARRRDKYNSIFKAMLCQPHYSCIKQMKGLVYLILQFFPFKYHLNILFKIVYSLVV